MEFTIAFKWHRDEAYEAMNDSTIDEHAKKCVMDLNPETITSEAIRKIYIDLAGKNELLSYPQLVTFMKADYEGVPRYVKYIQEILEYGVYWDFYQLNPGESDEFINSIHITSEDYGLEVKFTVPEGSYSENCDRKDYIREIEGFRDGLPDTLWEGMCDSLAVHSSGAVVDYKVW